MEVIKLDTKPVTTSQIVVEGFVRLPLAVFVWVCQVDKVGSVRQAAGSGLNVVLLAAVYEEGSMFGIQRRYIPFTLGFQE